MERWVMKRKWGVVREMIRMIENDSVEKEMDKYDGDGDDDDDDDEDDDDDDDIGVDEDDI